MSDFLAYLVERVLDPSAAPRPRIRSRFEPISPAAPETLEQVVERVTDPARPGRVAPRPSGDEVAIGESPRPVRAPRPSARREPSETAQPSPGARQGKETVAAAQTGDGEEISTPPRAARATAGEAVPRTAARADSISAMDGPEQARREPSEPVIRVSIGRVEVCAVLAPPSPRSRRAVVEPRRPSLDEYLSGRARRGTP